jgi:hypothetical protein
MLQATTIAAITLFVYYAVTFTKEPFNGIKNSAMSNWAVRIWALVLGIGAAIFEGHFDSGIAWTGTPMYDAVKAGAGAAMLAIITYHIGQPGFLGAFGADTSQPKPTASSPSTEIIETAPLKTVDKPTTTQLLTKEQNDSTLFASAVARQAVPVQLTATTL